MLMWLVAISAEATTSTASCPALCRASTSCLPSFTKDVDGRDKPGHDDGEDAPLRHRNLDLFGDRKPVVAFPGEAERPALGRRGEEGHERVGGDRREQRGREDLLAVILAGKRRDDVARDHPAVGAVAEAGLHHLRDQRLDLDHLAAPRLLRHVDEGARAHGCRSSRQAASVTTTSCVSDQNVPSDISAMAVIFCVSARRMRVAISAFPARGPNRTLITLACGFFSLNT